MKKKSFSGLDELMIVNPGLPADKGDLPLGQVFFSQDGTLYRLEELHAEDSLGEFAEFYLGEEGTLYRLEGFPSTPCSCSQKLGTSYRSYFLGADGTLYETIRS